LYRGHGGQDRQGSPSFDGQMDAALVTDAHAVMERYLIIGQQLLNGKVMQDGYQLSVDVQQCYLDYDSLTTSQPPTHVSSAWPRTLVQLQRMDHLLRSTFPQTSTEEQWHDSTLTRNSSENDYEYRYGSTTPGGGEDSFYIPRDHSAHSLATHNTSSSLGMDQVPKSSNNDAASRRPTNPFERSNGAGHTDRTVNMFSNIDKLFADRVDIYRRVDPLGVCGGLIRILIKAFHETTRLLQGMDEHVYHQLQLDIEFIQRTLWTFTTDEK
jgi:hypothetical protein